MKRRMGHLTFGLHTFKFGLRLISRVLCLYLMYAAHDFKQEQLIEEHHTLEHASGKMI